MEARREITKRMRTAATSNDDDTASQGSAGGGAAASSGIAVSTAATEMDGEEMAMMAAEAELVGSAETEENVQRIFLAIDSFTRKVSEMLESGRAMFKDLAADFEDRLYTIHKERVEKWEEEIRELRARDATNEQTRAVLHNAQLQLFHIRQQCSSCPLSSHLLQLAVPRHFRFRQGKQPVDLHAATPCFFCFSFYTLLNLSALTSPI